MIIEPLTEQHYPSVAAIFQEGIETGLATFETTVPSWEKWNGTHLANCRLVALENHLVVGWAALTAVSGRCVYAGVAEESVYVHSAFRGKGIGTRLLTQLIAESEQNQIWTLQAGIFPQNAASLRLHESLGFRLVGRRQKIGKLKNEWRDVLLMERRSAVVGII